jgi:ABC-2 type transport system ATP-binding protein
MLTIDRLTHVYPGGVRVLDAVSLEVPRGMFGLLGPNGAGKTTLMRCVASLLVPTSGTIRFGDIDVVRNPAALRRTLGYLPQDFGVYPRVLAYEVLDHMAVFKGIAQRSEAAGDGRGAAAAGQTCGTSGTTRWRGSRAACASGSASRRR